MGISKSKNRGLPWQILGAVGTSIFRAMSSGPQIYRNKRLGCQMGCAGTKILTVSYCINVALQSENMTSVDVVDLLEELTSTLGALKESIIYGSMSESTY